MFTANSLVAVEPFPKEDDKTEKVGGMAMPTRKFSLVSLAVMFDSFDKNRYKPEENVLLSPGDRVTIAGDKRTAEWAKKVYSIGDKSFILAPASEVLLIEREVRSMERPPPTSIPRTPIPSGGCMAPGHPSPLCRHG